MKIRPLKVEISLIAVCESDNFQILGGHKNSLGGVPKAKISQILFFGKNEQIHQK